MIKGILAVAMIFICSHCFSQSNPINAKGVLAYKYGRLGWMVGSTFTPLADSTSTATALAGKQATLGASSVTNTMLAGSIDLTTKVTGILPFANNAGTSAATSATTGTMTVNMTTKVITITPTGACTFNGSGGVVGQTSTFVITTSGTSAFVLTWGTNYKTTATLSTGTTTAKMFTVEFLCYATNSWIEIARTTAQ